MTSDCHGCAFPRQTHRSQVAPGERRPVAEAGENSEVGRARSNTPAMKIRVHHPHPPTRRQLARGYTRLRYPARHCERETAKAGPVSTRRHQRLTHDTGASVNGSWQRWPGASAEELSLTIGRAPERVAVVRLIEGGL